MLDKRVREIDSTKYKMFLFPTLKKRKKINKIKFIARTDLTNHHFFGHNFCKTKQKKKKEKKKLNFPGL